MTRFGVLFVLFTEFHHDVRAPLVVDDMLALLEVDVVRGLHDLPVVGADFHAYAAPHEVLHNTHRLHVRARLPLLVLHVAHVAETADHGTEKERQGYEGKTSMWPS